jgi:N-acetylneuraminic acid mutarotase
MKNKNYIKCLFMLISFAWISDLPAQNDWERMEDMPQATSWFGSCVDLNSDKAYIFGGSGPGSSLLLLDYTQVYDFSTDTWTLRTNMLQPSSSFSAELVNGKMYIMGEYSNPQTLTMVKEYDPVNDTWTEKGSIPEIFYAQGSCVYDGLIYLFGGRSIDPSPINTVRSYNTATDTWTELGDMPYGKYKSAVCIYENEIYLFGGNPSLKYIPSSDSWIELNTGDCDIDGYATPIVYGDRILLFGGYKFDGNYPNPCNEIWAYYPVEDMLVKLNNEMPFKRFTRGHKHNNYVYLFGGHYNNTLGSVTNEVWRLDLDLVSVKENDNLIGNNFIFDQIYPNPFSNKVTIEFELKQPEMVTITIYNHLGVQIEAIEKKQSQVKQQVVWNAEGLPAGVYFCVLKTIEGIQTTKMIKL